MIALTSCYNVLLYLQEDEKPEASRNGDSFGFKEERGGMGM